MPSTRPRPLVRVTVVCLLAPLLLFLCAGDLAWWQAWVLSALIVGVGVGGHVAAERRHPGLLEERERAFSRNAADVEPWDRVLAPLMALTVSFPLVIVAGLDHRFGWSPPLPLWLNISGLVLVSVGYAVTVWAFIENRFFSSMVRIQADRGHTVCDTGPYRYVRHPGYAGNLCAVPGGALLLGSVWGLIPAAIAVVIALVRSVLEDAALQKGLPGYLDYAKRVRSRLIPGVY